jgi:transposase-like protein/predicted nucleic-acid-binding Zn-ribbon protein
MFNSLTIQQFKKCFPTNDACMQYLVNLKWGQGYKCIKCGNAEYSKGRQWFYRRCKSCGYNESATANTIFHGVKLNLLRVFELAYRIVLRKKGMSTCELAKELGCQQKTAWEWKAKFQFAMKSSEKFDLEGAIEVDEFMVGGLQPGAPGRTPCGKALVVLAIEKVITKKGKESIGRAYAKTIDNGSAKSLQTIFEKHISKNSSVATDKWKGYVPLKKDWQITQTLSNKGEGMKMLHTHIMNLKGWLRGIHHKCSKGRLQYYLDEYHFRFNRRGATKDIFDKLLVKAMSILPHPYAAVRICEQTT